MKECLQCHQVKDNWQDFTRTNKDKPYEVDICITCRIKNLGGRK